MISVALILLIVAFILFIMAAFRWPAGAKLDLQALGLAFVVASWLFGHPGWKMLS